MLNGKEASELMVADMLRGSGTGEGSPGPICMANESAGRREGRHIHSFHTQHRAGMEKKGKNADFVHCAS